MPRVARPSEPSKRKLPPAKTQEARENQLIAAAVDLAEKQILEGTASSQVLTHYLKLATERERLEKERMISENQLAVAKIEQMGSTEEIKQLYGEALRAMRAYSGQDDGDYYDD